MPSHKEYEEAVDDPEGTFRDPDLRNAQPLRERGFPKARSGNHAVVFQMQGNANYQGDRGPWAVKCFTRPAHALKFRYGKLSEHLGKVSLPFVVEFKYLEDEMLIGGKRYPIVKMRWIEGKTLRQIVSENLTRETVLRQLCEIWPRIARRQHEASFTHCDLHHGNVLWIPRKRGGLTVKLIDLDGCWIPDLAGFPSGELGLPHYQHPERMQQKVPYSPAVDRFSHLVIYTALRALTGTGRELWDKFDMDDNLLFTKEDFDGCRQEQGEPLSSELFNRLWSHRDENVKYLAGHLMLAAGGALENVPLLHDLLNDAAMVRPINGRKADTVKWLLGITATRPNNPEIIPDFAEEEAEVILDNARSPADKPGSVYRNLLGMEFAFVPKGTFWMSGNEKNAQRQIEIPHDFYMGVYPVTQGEWEALMGNNPSSFSHKGQGKDKVKEIPGSQLKRFPVEQVSWEDCQEFLERLNQRAKDSGWLYRLPTEAEWEYSCRGGATSKEDCSFDFYLGKPTNELSSEHANFCGNSPAGYDLKRRKYLEKGKYLERPTEVGSYSANALGIFDMHGNVWEWCQDWYKEGSSRVDRGGSWRSTADFCRAGSRDWYAPVVRYRDLGFRVARVPSGK